LRNLAIADAKIGEGGGNALAMILQNPTINLTSLTLNATEMYESGKPYRDGDYYYNCDINGYNKSDEEEDADNETIEETEMEIDDDIVDDDNEMGAQAANILASGLCGNVTLKELEISHMGPVPSRQNLLSRSIDTISTDRLLAATTCSNDRFALVLYECCRMSCCMSSSS
jgi:hypothetical protein